MKSGQILWILLGLSIFANVGLGYAVYESTRVTTIDTYSYESFLSAVNMASESVDKVGNAKGVQRTNDIMITNMNMEKAGWILDGLESDFSQDGMQADWISGTLTNMTLSDPYSGTNPQDLQHVRNELHQINGLLSGTTYTVSGLESLKTKINQLNSSFMP